MASLRKTRGVDTELGAVQNFDDKKAAWGAMTSGRVLEMMFPETPLGDGNSLVEYKCNKNIEYNADTLARKAREYFQDIYNKNLAGVPIIPDIEDFCLFIGVGRLKFFQMCTGHQQDLAICGNNIRNAIAMCKKQMAFSGEIPPVVFAIDFNNNHDYVQARNQLQITTSFDADAQESIDEIASRLPQLEGKNPTT